MCTEAVAAPRVLCESEAKSVGGSVPRGLTAVDGQDNSCDERGLLEIENTFYNVANTTDSAQRMELCQIFIGRRIVGGVLYDSEGDCVEPNAARRVLDSQ